MTDDGEARTSPGLEELERLLHRLAGSRALTMRDQLPGDVRDAVDAKGQFQAFRMLLSMLSYYENYGEWPDSLEGELWDEYETVSRAMMNADATVNESDSEPKIGVQ